MLDGFDIGCPYNQENLAVPTANYQMPAGYTTTEEENK